MRAKNAAANALMARRETTGFWPGTNAPMPPIKMAMLPKWVKPHNA